MNADDNTQDWYSDENATFGDRIVAAREALGMADAELARRLGLKLKTVQSWEQDLSEPRANKLQMLAGVLDVSIRWLLTGQGSDVEMPNEAVEIDRDVQAILAEMRQLRGEMARNAERLGRLEKRLQNAIRDAAA